MPERTGIPLIFRASRALLRLNPCAVLLHACLFLPSLVAAANQPLTLRVSTEAAPPGGWAEFKVWAGAPSFIAAGELSMNFDPSIFGPVSELAVFSANGDQIGYATVNGEQLDVQFSSPSASIGQLPGLPVFEVSVPVLAGANPGATSIVTATAGGNWTDNLGNPYSVTASPGAFTVGGSLSVESVTPGGGLLPTGSIVQIAGTGFDSGTAVTIDGARIANIDVAGPGQINVTLGGATELTGKHVHVANSAGQQVDVYVAPPSAPQNPQSPADNSLGIQPILPVTAYTASEMYNPFLEHAGGWSFAFFNPSLTVATVTLDGFAQDKQLLSVSAYSIPPGQLYLIDVSDTLKSLDYGGNLWIAMSEPVRFVNIESICCTGATPGLENSALLPLPLTQQPPPLQVAMPASPSSVAWNWQAGTSAPAPATVTLNGSFDFNTSVSTTGGQWLSVSSTQNGSSRMLTLTPDPSGLAAGTYSGTVTVTPIAPSSVGNAPVVPTTISVSLTATSMPQISASPQGGCCLFFEPVPNQPAGPPGSLNVTTNGNPAQVTVSASTSSGGDWLSVSPASGTTPLQLTVTANPTGLNLAPGSYSGQITIQGPANTVTVMVGLQTLAPPPRATTLQINGPPPSFTLTAGSPPQMSAASFISFQEFDAALTSVESNVSWLTATILSPGPHPPASIDLYPNAVGLSPGTYSGTLTINSSNYPPLVVPLTLTVIAIANSQTMLTSTPSSLSFTAPSGGISATQTLAINFNDGPVNFNFARTPSWFQVTPLASFNPATPVYSVNAFAAGLPPGTYTAGFTVSWATGSFTIPITFSVTATSSFPPIITQIVSSASALPGAISPGEIISIFGAGVGPQPTGLQVDSSGKVATSLAGTQVLVGGVPCPLIYVSANQINAIVPFESGSSGTAAVRVMSNSLPSAEWEIPLAPAAPAIFAANASGVGQAAVLNQDNSLNGSSNPATRGSVIQIFATGGGQTQAQAIDGAIAQAGEMLAQPVTVTIGGVTVPAQFAGSAPGEVEGVVQVNALIPQSVAPGPSVPVALSIGGAPSPEAATISVQ